MSTGRGDGRFKRRTRSILALVVAATVSTTTLPLWLPGLVVADLVRGARRLPLTRLAAFGVCWVWIEIAGVLRTFTSWLRGRATDPTTQYDLMKWWAGALMRALDVTIGLHPRLEGREALATGNAVVLCRHASLADSLLSAWAIRVQADLWPRYVLKHELLADPCLDIVGQRVPNHFLDRTGGDDELDQLRALSSGMTDREVSVIFAEGTRSTRAKRHRALERIATRDAERADRLRTLQHLLPPRPGGAGALLRGAPDADVVLAWHTGFDGLDSFGGIIRQLAAPRPPVLFVVRRVPRGDVPDPGREPGAFERWLDKEWLRMDSEVADALANGS